MDEVNASIFKVALLKVKSAKFDKASIYEKMLPSIALVVVLLDE